VIEVAPGRKTAAGLWFTPLSTLNAGGVTAPPIANRNTPFARRSRCVKPSRGSISPCVASPKAKLVPTGPVEKWLRYVVAYAASVSASSSFGCSVPRARNEVIVWAEPAGTEAENTAAPFDAPTEYALVSETMRSNASS